MPNYKLFLLLIFVIFVHKTDKNIVDFLASVDPQGQKL